MNQGGTPSQTDLLAQIHDIRGLDAIGAWPPGVGWWIVLAAVFAAALYDMRRRAYARSWKGDARRELEALEEKLSPESSRVCVDSLSAIVRRIAMKKFSRQACAGLEGQGWLDWLKANDPRGFDWVERGKMLVKVPYAPPGKQINPEKIKELIAAAKAWVK